MEPSRTRWRISRPARIGLASRLSHGVLDGRFIGGLVANSFLAVHRVQMGVGLRPRRSDLRTCPVVGGGCEGCRTDVGWSLTLLIGTTLRHG